MTVTKLRLHQNTEHEFSIKGYRLNYVSTVLYSIFAVVTLGLAVLPLYWKPNWLMFILFTPCESLLISSDVLIEDAYKRYSRRRLFKLSIRSENIWKFLHEKLSNDSILETSTSVSTDSVPFSLDESSRGVLCFTYQKTTYVISNDGLSASKFPSLATGLTTSEASANVKQGLSLDEVAKRREVFGSNEIDINPKSVFTLFVQECLHPFYLFQLFSVTVWFVDEYYYYSACIVVLSVLSIGWALYMTCSQQKKVVKMTKGDHVIDVLRDGVLGSAWQRELVPGDIVSIPQNGCMLTFDSLLLTGSCIVNECMLTGESVPVTKTTFTSAHVHSLYSPKYHTKFTLFSGTSVLQSRSYSNDRCYAVVINTGFYTMKGELIRSILYPKPMSFRLFFDAIMFVLFLVGVSMIGFVYTLVLMINRQVDVAEIILRPLDIITIAVPPALPAALNIGMVFAQRRLKRWKIFCISPRRIDVAGSINVVCFDKTGTLTEDDMEFKNAVTVDKSTNFVSNEVTDVKSISNESPVSVGLSACHTLIKIDGKIVGDPMDLKLFLASGWSYAEQGTGTGFDYESLAPSVVTSPKDRTGKTVDIAIVRQFPFSSEMQRMAVIVRDEKKDHFEFFLKGSPEKVAQLCTKLPGNFSQSLEFYANNGYRVLALAYKPLDTRLAWHKVHKVTLGELESGLEFLGFLVFHNKLKKASSPVIHRLQEADIRSIMVTGDNIATAIAVARGCSIIRKAMKVKVFYQKEDVLNFFPRHISSDTAFACTGDAFSALKSLNDEFLIAVFLKHTCVFARMTPDQKAELVELLQKSGLFVGMCGDGANDCGALKLAHVGISLSELEASAAAPFTSAIPDVSCVDKLIREGRASLVNSFATFKFMGLYSMIQFTSIVILYWYESTLGDLQFLYIDLGIITLLMLTMGGTEASPTLSRFRPPVRLFNAVIFLSLVTAIVVQFVAQIISLFILRQFSWFEPADKEEEAVEIQENATIFLVSSFLYIVSAIGFSPGYPHRKNLFTNLPYMAVIAILMLAQLVILFRQESWTWIQDTLELVYLPSFEFKIIILGISALCLLILVILEFYLLADKEKLSLPPVVKSALGIDKCCCKQNSSSKYQKSIYTEDCSPNGMTSLPQPTTTQNLPDFYPEKEFLCDEDTKKASRHFVVISSL